jgi:hypothetical protein
MVEQEKKTYTEPEVVSYGSITALTAATESGSSFDGNFNYGEALPDEDGDGILDIAC